MSASEHFKMEGGDPTAPGRFVTVSDVPAVEFLPGLEFRPIPGERMLANQVTFQPHTEAPVHSHEEEQIVVVTEGELEFSIDGEIRMMKPGDIAVIPAWVPHGARTRDTVCVELDMFSPPRRTLMEHLDRNSPGEG